MKKMEGVKQIVLGLVVGLLLIPAPVAEAQWTVFDPTQFGLQIEKKIEEAARWIETIDHYAREIEKYGNMIENQVKQITSLGGILNTVDEQLARHRRLVGTVARVGQTVRSAFQLKDQLARMVTCQIKAVQRMWQRLENGIFDAEQNRQDLEEYLRYTIGRSSQGAISHIELLANQDVRFQELIYQRELAYVRLSKLREKMLDIQAQLNAELAKPEGEQQGVAELNAEMAACEATYEALVKHIDDLSRQIADKCAKYGVVLDKNLSFAKHVRKDLEWFENMTRLNDEVMDALAEAFDPNTEVAPEPMPDDFVIPFTPRQPPVLRR